MQFLHMKGSAPYYTNSFLLLSENKNAVIIDPAASAGEYRKELELRDATLKAVLCTHGHFDHLGAAVEICKDTGATLYCAKQDVGYDNHILPLLKADEDYADEQIIEVDEMKFRVIRTPGHTEGSVCILLDKYLFTGDTLFFNSVGRTDLQGGSMQKLIESCKKLKGLNLPADTAVLPGHEDFSTYGWEMENNDFIKAYCD